jgi:hypothetical protein
MYGGIAATNIKASIPIDLGIWRLREQIGGGSPIKLCRKRTTARWR